MKAKLFILIFVFLLLFNFSYALEIGEGYFPRESDLSVVQAAYSGQPIVCNGFNVTSGEYSVSQVSMPLKRQSGAVGNFEIRIYNSTSAHIPDNIISYIGYNDGVNFTLDGSLRYYNFTIPKINVYQDIEYFVCVWNNNANNYIHLYQNSSNAYLRSGFVAFTTSWQTSHYASRDMPFIIYKDDTPIPSMSINTDLINGTYVDSYTTENINFNVSFLNTEIINGNCELLVNDVIFNFIDSEDLRENMQFSYYYDFLNDIVKFQINCTTSELNAISNPYFYVVDTTRFILYEKLLNLENNLIGEDDKMILSLIIFSIVLYAICIYLLQKGLTQPVLFISAFALPIDLFIFAEIYYFFMPKINTSVFYLIGVYLMLFWIPAKITGLFAIYNQRKNILK